MKHNKLFLYTGLTLLLLSLILKYFGAITVIYVPIFIAAIVLKLIFLINIFKQKNSLNKTGLYIILSGVVLIIISLIFKKAIPMPVVNKILFYMAITLKISGVLHIITNRKTNLAKNKL